jgi:hypothetical protein
MLLAMLRRAKEHLHEIVVQAVEKLALKCPLELRVVEVTGMQFEVVGVNRRILEFRTDDYLNGFPLGAGIELDEWMLIEAQLVQHALETVRGHGRIVDEVKSAHFGMMAPEQFVFFWPVAKPALKIAARALT